ncbi:MAG: hypothetical protein Q8930_16790 [Bacillota bacterium]|nr:hypothetical protein [Bacillota bacterium]
MLSDLRDSGSIEQSQNVQFSRTYGTAQCD